MTSSEAVDQARGFLLTGAIGDALGAAVDFDSWDTIPHRFGEKGLTDLVPAYGRRGAITDDTQMTLFTAEGLIRAGVRMRGRGICHPPSVVRHAYLRWLHTQGEPVDPSVLDGWLITNQSLFSRRAPGTTCPSALRASAADGTVFSTQERANHSKGCGGVMRAAPAGFCTTAPADAFELDCDVAALSHGHPSGYLPAGVLAATISAMRQGADMAAALDVAMVELARYPGARETQDALAAGRQLGTAGRPTPTELESLAGGWTGEECLGIAVAAALAADDVVDGLLLAVNHGGDSDSTGAVAGFLLGTLRGAGELPGDWLAQLELRDVIEQVADDLVSEFGASPPSDGWGVPTSTWFERYPGW